jgi:hypothetical protein
VNSRNRILFAAIIAWFAASAVQAQDSHTINVPFDNPGRPGVVKIYSGEGNITVTGYAGREVLIKANTKGGKPNPDDDPKARGLKRIAGPGFTVSTDREENAVIITRSLDDRTDMEIQAPFNTVLKVGGKTNSNDIRNTIATSVAGAITGYQGGLFEGNITVDSISGDMELGTMDGNITLKNISGGVAVNSLDGNTTAVFKSIPDNRPLAFSTVDGNIDIALPATARITVTAKNADGSIYTDFELETTPVEIQREPKDSSILGSITGPDGNSISGKINGGGTSVQLRTVDGNIYIRKAK